MPLDVFRRLESCLPHAKALLLNGVGEPLLHPLLPDMVRFAREIMSPESRIGFQSNGLLLTEELALELVRAGLDTMCLSIDTLCRSQDTLCRPQDTLCHPQKTYDSETTQAAPESSQDIQRVTKPTGKSAMDILHGGAHAPNLARAFGMLRRACIIAESSRFRIGAEFVIMRSNLYELPEVVRWAAEQGVSYLLASHVLPYNREAAAESAFTQDTPEALAFYARWQEIAKTEGLDLTDYYSLFRKFHRTDREKRLVSLVQTMQQEASEAGLFLHLKRLVENDRRQRGMGAGKNVADVSLADVEAVFAASRAMAAECGIELHLPTPAARVERRCDFVEDGAVFISPDGGVHPCYFLWHTYSCHLDGQQKFVRPERFGSVRDEPLEMIWRSAAYSRFRNDVCAYEYPDCTACTMGPCDDMTGVLGLFEHDCHGVTVPCGHCPWCLGGLQCLL